jgi:putative acetyltransferase
MASNSTFMMTEAAGTMDFTAARALFEEYAAQLRIDLCFQGFAAELRELAQMYGPPSGCLLLVRREETPVACGALRGLSREACEMKRLYVRPDVRGAKLGRLIAERLVVKARALGYTRMLLDTLQEMIAAQTLYRSMGFRETAPYYRNPLADVVYMELDLNHETP